MATYKVIQDIEAEDKFLGPLTLKQFIFGAAGIFFGYLSFFAVSQNAAFLLIIFLPPGLLGFFLAIPWSSEQSTEVWVLAKLRFLVKPKTRIWDQAGLEELVTVTAPKKIERQLTDGLDQDQVRSRLKALAETIDTRGWATKNIGLNEISNGVPIVEDRLVGMANLPLEVPEYEATTAYDVLDDQGSVSENFQHMIQDNSDTIRRESLERMERVRRGEAVEVIGQQEVQFTPPPDSYAQPAYDSAQEKMIADQLQSNRSTNSMANQRMHTLSPNGPQPQKASQPTAQQPQNRPAESPVPQAQAEMTQTPDPVILNLARDNDKTLDTLSRQARRDKESDDGEVVVSLR